MNLRRHLTLALFGMLRPRRTRPFRRLRMLNP